MFILYSIRAMFIQIEDPSDLPRPPEEVHIRAIAIDPYPDGQRLRVTVELSPFMEPPDLSLRVLDAEELEIAELSIIGAHQTTLGLTVHLRGAEKSLPYRLEASVHYEDLGEVHHFVQPIEFNQEPGNEQA